jgi:hypothetical protein
VDAQQFGESKWICGCGHEITSRYANGYPVNMRRERDKHLQEHVARDIARVQRDKSKSEGD